MANTLVMFDSIKLAVWNGTQHLSGTYRCALLSTGGGAPDLDTSTVASLTGQFCTQLSGDPATKTKQCPGAGQATALITSTGAAGVIKFDLSDIAFTASSGTNLSARYGLVFRSAAAAVIPVGYWELSTAEVVSNQINVTWPATGLFTTLHNAP